MLKTAGSTWFDHNVPDEVKKSIGKVLDKNGLSLDETGEDQLYYADFIQLVRFFFDAYPLKPLTQEAVSKIREAANGDKEKLEEVLNTYTARSNWDRYFV